MLHERDKEAGFLNEMKKLERFDARETVTVDRALIRKRRLNSPANNRIRFATVCLLTGSLGTYVSPGNDVARDR